ncbi:2-C-methyl-D-erythritol 4-phosphate cytidylyltransferase [Nocardioides zeae]|uniref:2-C-methyl-D-erythritol 4-phosphate cytidylyltransferase n=1 Tax=Nocardioides imazamoxiresistens TaxID=3231893 RepID=A0ABU3PZH0_9ACTN|nr:2-C-methyl-D-erythritol 4-phosphate cytidylyltransferase [Nocardioides zeae]MDT9594165.1 2-C-methyl-D-erythritol 4-phosphate cytidylyltransferase [Nocardioides zeae]
MSVAAVVLAGGSGTRVGAEVNKVLLPLAGAPLLARSVATVAALPDVAVVVVVARAGDEEAVAAAVGPHVGAGPEVRLTVGGATRHASEAAALAALTDTDVDVVTVHDAARPLADADLYARVVAAAREHGGAVPAVPLPGLVRRDGGPVPGLAGDAVAVGVQTPQGFRADLLREAYAHAARTGFEGTDTAACVAAHLAADGGGDGQGGSRARIVVVGSSPTNLKVTYAEDVAVVARLA